MTFETAKGVIALDVRASRSGRYVEELSFRPRALVLWWSRQEQLGLAPCNRGGIGIAVDGSEQACSAWAADDALAPAALTRLADDTALVGMGHPGESRAAFRGAVSCVEDGFVIDWSAVADGVWHVHYLALGGSELHGAAVGTVALDRPGVTAVTRLGFAPEFLLFLPGAGGARAEPIAGLCHGIGLATGEKCQAAAGVAAQAGDRTSTVRSGQRTDAVVALPELGPSSGFGVLAQLVSLDSDGFTLDVSQAAPELPLAYLALAGGRYAAGADTAPPTSGRSKTGSVGFEPAALLTFSWGMAGSAAVKEVPRLCLGGADRRGNAGCLSWAVRSRGVWPLEPRVRSVLGSVLEVMDTKSGNLHAQAVLGEAGPHGFTLDWDTDGLRREFAYAAFASARARRPLRTRLAGMFQDVASSA